MTDRLPTPPAAPRRRLPTLLALLALASALIASAAALTPLAGAAEAGHPPAAGRPPPATGPAASATRPARPLIPDDLLDRPCPDVAVTAADATVYDALAAVGKQVGFGLGVDQIALGRGDLQVYAPLKWASHGQS